MITQKNLVVVLLSLIVLLGIGTFFASKQLEKLPQLNENYLQAKLEEAIMLKGEGKKGEVDYKVRSANIHITDEIFFDFAIDLKGYGFSGDVVANVKGVPIYNKEKRAFYFTPSEEIEFQKLQIDGDFKPKGILGKIAAKSSLVQNVMADNQLIKQIAEKAITLYLQNLPVYTLPKDKFSSQVVGIALNKVEVSNGEILIDISFWELTKSVIFFLFAIVIAIAIVFAAITHPEIFGTLLIVGAIQG